MKEIMNELVNSAMADDAAAGEIAGAVEQRLKKREEYNKLETLLNQYGADGMLDKNELESLMAEFKRQGLDTKTLHKLLDKLKNGETAVRLDDNNSHLLLGLQLEIQNGKASTDASPMENFKIQMILASYKNKMDGASNVSKADHNIGMTIIKTMVG
jgi:hypothetical protein